MYPPSNILSDLSSKKLRVKFSGVSEPRGGVDKIDKWETGENLWEGYCFSRGGYLPLPGFALWVERMMDQGQGGARDRGQG